jgi:hypothetical protein
MVVGTFAEKDVLVCSECGKKTLKKSVVQKYCRPCSAKKDKERKTKWARDNKDQTPKDKEKLKERFLRRKELGAAASLKDRVSITWPVGSDPKINRSARFVVPWDRRFSKNVLWSSNSRGHVYMREEIKMVRDSLVNEIQKCPLEWYEGKVWLDIFVEKPDARSDAVNVIDAICDAVKRAIAVDDRWFCIKRLDWSVVKTDPKIILGISQEVTEHHRVCSYCGAIKPLIVGFGKNRSGPLGHTRECRECATALRRAKKKS